MQSALPQMQTGYRSCRSDSRVIDDREQSRRDRLREEQPNYVATSATDYLTSISMACVSMLPTGVSACCWKRGIGSH